MGKIKQENKEKKKKRKEKKIKGNEKSLKGGRRPFQQRRETEREREKYFFSLLSKIYENRTVGFHRSKRQSWSTHRELHVGIKILEFR